MPSSIVWFRNDLRLADNPALRAAVDSGRPVVPVFVLDEKTKGLRPPGGASLWWLHHSLAALDASLRDIGSRLILKRGPADKLLSQLAIDCEAEAIYCSRSYEPAVRDRDARVKERFVDRGIAVEEVKSNLLFEPWEVKTGAGGPFKVFTPFWRACRALQPPAAPLPAPTKIAAPKRWPAGDKLDDWKLPPTKPDWAGGLREAWTPGEAAAAERLTDFLDEALADYPAQRDLPAVRATSRLSPHLSFGEISPRQIWRAATTRRRSAATEKFLTELGWREFAYHVTHHFGDLSQKSFRPEFDGFPWASPGKSLEAWQRGRTGYPIVDAGMRELWTTGIMHNRVRMIVASFLTKHLLIDWREGERWFWDTLVDADPANNPFNWQWVAGCGADVAPYFRIFNPILQGEKFDPRGDYVRRWIPELSDLPAREIHQPWIAGSLLTAGYPPPIVDHAGARTRALEAFRSLRAG